MGKYHKTYKSVFPLIIKDNDNSVLLEVYKVRFLEPLL